MPLLKRVFTAHTGDLTQGPPGKRLFLYMIPILITNLFQQCYNLADTIIVGQLVGAGALAAVGGTGPVFYLCSTVTIGFAAGVGILSGQYFGGGRTRSLRDIFTTATVFTALSSVVIGAVGAVCAPWLLALLRTPADVLADSVTYLRMVFLGFPFMGLGASGAAVLSALGDSKTPLCCTAAGGLCNVVLNLFFVLVCRLGVFGVALATVLGQLLTCLLGLPLLLKKLAAITGQPQLPLRRVPGHFSGKLLKEVLRLGLSSSLQGAVLAGSLLLMQSLINGFGSLYMAAYTTVQKIEWLVLLPLNNLYQAFSNFTAQNIGAGKLPRVRRCYRLTLLWGTGFCAVMALVLLFGSRGLASLFVAAGSDEQVITAVGDYFKVAVVYYFPLVLMFQSEGLLRGAGDVLTVSVITGAAMVFRLVTAFILAPKMGFSAIPLAFLASYTSEAIIAYLRYCRGRWRHKAVVLAR